MAQEQQEEREDWHRRRLELQNTTAVLVTGLQVVVVAPQARLERGRPGMPSKVGKEEMRTVVLVVVPAIRTVGT